MNEATKSSCKMRFKLNLGSFLMTVGCLISTFVDDWWFIGVIIVGIGAVIFFPTVRLWQRVMPSVTVGQKKKRFISLAVVLTLTSVGAPFILHWHDPKKDLLFLVAISAVCWLLSIVYLWHMLMNNILSFLEADTVKIKLFMVSAVSIFGIILFALFSFSTLNDLKVNGKLYKRIVQGKDLIADILPPPVYIIETHSIGLQLLEETDPRKINILIEVARSLENDYDNRHEYWVNEDFGNTHADKELKDAITVMSFGPVAEFYEIFFGEFIPLIQNGERDKARVLFNNVLTPKYKEHRLGIDKAVAMAIERNIADEQGASKRIRSATVAMISFLVTMIVVILILCLYIIN